MFFRYKHLNIYNKRFIIIYLLLLCTVNILKTKNLSQEQVKVIDNSLFEFKQNGFYLNGTEYTWGQLIHNKEFLHLTSISSSTLRKWSHNEDFVNFIAS